MNFSHILIFALAAGAGAFLRFMCSALVARLALHLCQKYTKTAPIPSVLSSQIAPTFPWSIFSVNILGCLAFGITLSFTQNLYPLSIELKSCVFTGFFGAFTTFSTYIFEIYTLWKDGYYISCFFYFFGQLALGGLAMWVGLTFFS